MTNKNCNYCNSCNYCNYCDSCNSCNYCNYCDSCDYCDSCNSCDSCDYCNYCNSCNSCNYCNSCNSCVNLKMTEYNYFCYAEDKSKDGFQRPRYQIFNKQLTEKEYSSIEKVHMQLEFDRNEDYETRYKTAFKKAWDKLDNKEKQKIINLPGFNAGDFKKYYGVDIEEIKTIIIDGKEINISKESFEEFKKQLF